ncbi:MAG: hypothetical protein M1821_004593 [Bathelium mastoideum]|nr:MAG: hypothetical protein M1821_004593 [Bathelium mastoideum]
MQQSPSGTGHTQHSVGPAIPRYTAREDGYHIRKDNGELLFYSKYAHQPLSGPRTIRLIKHNPNPQRTSWVDGSVLNHFVIEERSLDEPGLQYVALSYAWAEWGSGNVDAPLTLGTEREGSVLLVTSNAWMAVNTMATSLPLWVDQTSINQNDDKEKEEQIKLMGDIYSKCWVCAIWLGPELGDSNAGFQFAQELCGQDGLIPAAESLPKEVIKFCLTHPHSRIREELRNIYGRDRLPSVTDPGWAAFARCLQRLWFTRLWTFQETLLPGPDAISKVSVVCGRRSTTLQIFTRTSYFLGSDNSFGVDHATGRAALNLISHWQFRMQHNLPRPLLLLLDSVRNYDCEKPNDRIYALLGLQAEDMPMEPIDVSIERPTDELYMDVTQKIIRARSSLLVCLHAPGRIGGKVPNLPSWVPDWTAKATRNLIEMVDPNDSQFRADQGRVHLDTKFRFNRRLVTRGKLVDKVEEIIDCEVPDGVSDIIRKDRLLRDVLPHIAASLASQSKHPINSADLLKIFKTITLDGVARKYTGDLGMSEMDWTLPVVEQMLCHALSVPTESQQAPSQDDFDRWMLALSAQALFCATRRFALLEINRLGLLPQEARKGDIITVLHGLSMPVVLRDDSRHTDLYRLIGHCFVDGIMYGESVSWEAAEAPEICIE